MHVLGIETSCDETSAAIVTNGSNILSNIVSSSLRFHKLYGGVVPEIAFRKQLETITQVTDSAIRDAGISIKDIGLICVTSEPGLLGSLVVGISFAKSLSLSLKTELLGVNHLFSHIYASLLEKQHIKMPFVALIVSGGHTSLFNVQGFDDIRPLGLTLDDACGETFDKVAKILNLGYPGGPIIEQLARRGNPDRVKFKCSGTDKDLDFSFSGIKTAVLYYAQKHRLDAKSGINNKHIVDVCASFQESVIDVLVNKSICACKKMKTRNLVVGGGVAANMRLREVFLEEAEHKGIEVHFPPKALCMDNAAMVAGLGYHLFKKGLKSDLYLAAKPS